MHIDGYAHQDQPVWLSMHSSFPIRQPCLEWMELDRLLLLVTQKAGRRKRALGSQSGKTHCSLLHSHTSYTTSDPPWQQLPARTTRKSTTTARSHRTPKSTALARMLLEATTPTRTTACSRRRAAASSLEARRLTTSLPTSTKSTASAEGEFRLNSVSLHLGEKEAG